MDEELLRRIMRSYEELWGVMRCYEVFMGVNGGFRVLISIIAGTSNWGGSDPKGSQQHCMNIRNILLYILYKLSDWGLGTKKTSQWSAWSAAPPILRSSVSWRCRRQPPGSSGRFRWPGRRSTLTKKRWTDPAFLIGKSPINIQKTMEHHHF